MDNMFWIGLAGAAAALFFAWFQRRKVLAFSEGNDTMKKIAAAIRQGANAYLKHQYARPEHCLTASDKALAVGGGVLEALLHFSHRLED